MKTLKTLLLAGSIFCILPLYTQAQFLKKLGKTVKEIAKESLSSDQAGDKNSGEERSQGNSSGSVNKEVPKQSESTFNYAQYNIAVSKVATASFHKGEYFKEPYSTIEVKDNKLFPRVVVGVLSEKERLSEGQEISKNDIAHVYENGLITKDVPISNLDKSWLILNKQYDYYPILGNSDQTYVKQGKDKISSMISFGGKTYGPYSVVFRMIVNKAKTKFYATVAQTVQDLQEEKNYLLSNDGKLKSIPFGGELLANINFTNGCTIVSPIAVLGSKVAHEENEAKQEALQKQWTDLMVKHPNEGEVIFFGGKKVTNILTESPWLDYSGNNIFTLQADAEYNLPAGLFLNGKNIANETPSLGQGHAWCNAEATNWAYESNDGKQTYLIFKDGAKVPNALHPREIELNGKYYMAWFSYSGAKKEDILMCNKAL